MTKSHKGILEALTKTYWAASTTLSSHAGGITSKIAIGHLFKLSQNPDYTRLRCVAAGRLASLGMSDLVHAPEGAPNVAPGNAVFESHAQRQ